MPIGISIFGYVRADSNAVTTEVLVDEDILRRVGSVEKVAAEDCVTKVLKILKLPCRHLVK